MHDFNGGIAPSGLFWTVQVPDGALVFNADHTTATLHLENVPVIDTFQFSSPNPVPASVSFDMTWTATRRTRLHLPGSNDPTDPTNWRGKMAEAVATGTFSGSETGFSFASDPGATSAGLFAELGVERNGSML